LPSSANHSKPAIGYDLGCSKSIVVNVRRIELIGRRHMRQHTGRRIQRICKWEFFDE